MVYMYTFINDYFYTTYIDNTLNQSTSHLEDSVVNNLRIIENSYYLISSNQDIREYLYYQKNNEASYYNDQYVKLNIETELKYIMGADYAFNQNLIESVFVFSDEDHYYSVLSNYLPNESLLNSTVAFYKDHQLENQDILEYKSAFNTIFYLKTLKDYITGEELGKIIVGVNYEVLKGAYEFNDNIGWSSVIFDTNGISRFNTEAKLIGKEVSDDIKLHSSYSDTRVVTIENTSYFSVNEYVNDLNFRLVNYIPKNYFEKGFWNFLPNYVYFILLSILISMIAGIYFVSSVTEPLQSITTHIAETSKSNFHKKMPSYKYKELNDLSIVYNQMIDQIQYLFNEVYEKQLLVRESELKALHAQINPHFIFNVLESITWEARMSDNEKIEQMTTALGQLLRSSLSFTNQEKYSIEQELEYVNFYLYLQSVRFPDRLSYEIQFESDNILHYFLPKFSIQTLVENAIIHGIETKTEHGSLNIRIEETDKDIFISVEDNGIGFDSSHLELDHLKNDRLLNGQHIGLQNINQRIKLLYGKNYGITINSTIGVGTTANITIPKDEEC